MIKGDLVRVVAPEEVDGVKQYVDKVGKMFKVSEVFEELGTNCAVLETLVLVGDRWQRTSFVAPISCLKRIGSISKLMSECEVKEYILDDEDIVLAQVKQVDGETLINVHKKLPDLGAHMPKLRWYERLCKCTFCGKRFPMYRILDPNVFPDNDVGDKDIWKVCGECRIHISGTMFGDMSKALDKKMERA